MRKRRIRLGDVALLMVSSLLGWLIAEGVVRALSLINVAAIQTDMVRLSTNPRLLYELVPLSMGHNSRGFRGPEFSEQPSPDSVRVLGLGDSLMYGLRNEEKDSLPRQLEARLNSSRTTGPAFEVLNLGVPGYSIIQTAEQFFDTGQHLGARVAVLLVCMNDWEPYTVEFDILLGKEPGLYPLLTTYYDPSARGVQRLLRHSHFFLLLKYRWEESAARVLERVRAAGMWTDGPLVAAPTTVKDYFAKRPFYGDHFKRLAAGLQERDIKLVVMLVPEATAGTDASPYQERLQEISTLTRAAGGQLVNFPAGLPAGVFDGDQVHLTPPGNAMLAEALVEPIRTAAKLHDPLPTQRSEPSDLPK